MLNPKLLALNTKFTLNPKPLIHTLSLKLQPQILTPTRWTIALKLLWKNSGQFEGKFRLAHFQLRNSAYRNLNCTSCFARRMSLINIQTAAGAHRLQFSPLLFLLVYLSFGLISRLSMYWRWSSTAGDQSGVSVLAHYGCLALTGKSSN